MAEDFTPSSGTSETPPPRTTGGSSRWEPPSAAELQALMPGYTIEKLLGRGGMGAVYRGMQTNLDRPVAIKILPPGVEKEDPSFAERFKNEARLMAKLMNPAVVGVFDFGTTLGGQLYIAMEYVDGSDVAQMIAAQKKLTPEHALAITAHVCDALTAAHELGIVHRDIKPANILINMKGQVKVADFGLAKIEEPGSHGLTKTGYAMGTPDFVAPEALMLGTAIDGRADIYAVGVMLYQMLTGQIPRGAWQPASVLSPGADRRFDEIITKAMQYDRESRYQSSAELRRALDVILTVPMVRRDAPSQAAIPVAQVAQVPAQRSAMQKPVGKSPQQPKAGAVTPVSSTAKKPEADPSARAPLPAKKSSAGMIFGIAAAAAVIAVLIFMFAGGGRKPEANKPAAVKPTAAATTPKQTPALKLSSSTEPWVNAMSHANLLKVTAKEGAALRMTDAARRLDINLSKEIKDGAVRMLITSDAASIALCGVSVRRAGSSFYNFHVEPNFLHVGLGIVENGAGRSLKSLRMPESAQRPQAQPVELELRAIGTTLIARVNGWEAARFEDPTLTEGCLSIRVDPGVLLHAVETLDLSKPAAAPSPASTAKVPLSPAAAPAPAATPASAPAAASILPTQEPIRYTFPLPVPQRSTTAGQVMVWRLDGKPMGDEDALLLPPADLQDVVQVSAFVTISGGTSAYHALALRADGTVSGLGDPKLAAIQVSSTLKNVVKVVSAGSRGFALTEDGQVVSWGGASLNRENIAKLQGHRVVDLVATNGVDLALLDSGELRSMRNAAAVDEAIARIGPCVAVNSAAGGSTACLTPDGKLAFLGGKPASTQLGKSLIPMLRRKAQRLVVLDNESGAAIALGEAGLVGAFPADNTSSLQPFAGLTDAAAFDGINAFRIGNQWKFDARGYTIDTAFCELQARDCISLSLTSKYAFGIKPVAVIVAAAKAKMVDAATAIPELKALHDQFVKLTAERVAAPYEADVAKLNAGYVGGIDRKIAEETTAGHLDGIIALEAEKKLLADKHLIPAEDADSTTANLKSLRAIYRTAYAKIEAARVANLRLLTEPLTLRLKTLETELTKQQRVPDAKTVREYREKLGVTTDAPSSASAPQTAPGGSGPLPRNARKDGFTNSLGMKFVSVPGTEVLFCIHETRKSDYAAYASETAGVDNGWKNLVKNGQPISEENDHPVVMVSWNGAQEFCAWMSKKEKRTYRLPTDREWSMAVGIGHQEKKGATPESLNEKISDEYPWGSKWPPSQGAGNYPDTAFKEKYSPDGQTVEGYSDGYATTSPVMRFKANKLGIFDLGGNVWEYCADWMNDAQNMRVLRGGSWNYFATRSPMTSSTRIGIAPQHSGDGVNGFRVVVETAVP